MDHRVNRIVLPALAILLGSTGCEKVSELISPKSSATTTSATPPPPAFPSRPQAAPSEVVAKVNDKTISVRELEYAIKDLKAARESFGAPWTPLTKDDLQNLSEGFVMDELRAQDAIARGLDRKTDAQYRFLNRYRTFYAQEWVTWQLDQLHVTQQDIEAFYNDPRNQPFSGSRSS